MSYGNHKTTIMPKITQSIRKEKTIQDEKKMILRKDDLYNQVEADNNTQNKDKEKKPGSSIEHKKPSIFPKIYSTKISPPTPNYPSSERDVISVYKNNKISINGDKAKKAIFDEGDKDEKNESIKHNKINIINSININSNSNSNSNSNNNNNNIYHPPPQVQINNEHIEEKKSINNKTVVDINNYKDISVNFLINNNELNQMFEKLYKNDNNTKKKWVEMNLFSREVFKIRLETYVKNKMDIPSFIKNEIHKILSNQYCDYVFAESYKQIQTQYEEHMKDIENIYN
jgi:hypothetical protein